MVDRFLSAKRAHLFRGILVVVGVNLFWIFKACGVPPMRMFVRAVPIVLASHNLAERHRRETHEHYDSLTSKSPPTEKLQWLPLVGMVGERIALNVGGIGPRQSKESVFNILSANIRRQLSPPVPNVLNPCVDIRRSRSRYPWTTTTPSHTAILPHWKHENRWV